MESVGHGVLVEGGDGKVKIVKGKNVKIKESGSPGGCRTNS